MPSPEAAPSPWTKTSYGLKHCSRQTASVWIDTKSWSAGVTITPSDKHRQITKNGAMIGVAMSDKNLTGSSSDKGCR